MHKSNSIRVGLVADDSLWMEGLAGIFEHPPEPGQAPLHAMMGSLEELLASAAVDCLVVDLRSSLGRVNTLVEIRRARPGLRLIVIGPSGNDELVMDCIIGGARAYLDLTAGSREVREAVEVVSSGSIWAPRRLLAKLIERLLASAAGGLAHHFPHFTARECQVLDLILAACSNREIARQLGIEERTVKAHVGRLMRKTGAQNRIDLSIRALRGSDVSPSR